MIIALTGATGFIGSRLLARLSGEGHAVRALTRRAGALAPGVTEIPGDLGNAAALRELVRGADAVMHLAGAVRGATAADFDGPNVEGTRLLLQALDAESPRTPLLLMSSLAAREPALSYYAASKRRAEDLLAGWPGARPYLVLRPPAVYGPGDREMLPVFRFMARTGLAPCAGRRTDRLSLVFVDDLVAAVLAWLPHAAGIRAACALHDGRSGGYDWDALAAIAGRACGRTVRVWELPRGVLDAAARINPALCALGGRLPMLSPGKLRELRHPDWVCDNGDATRLLGWTPSTGLDEGLRATPGWKD